MFMLAGALIISLSSGMVVYRLGLSFLDRPFHYSEWSLYLPLYVAFGLAALCIDLPVFSWLRERRHLPPSAPVFALVGALLGMVPIYGLRISGDARLADPMSPEALIIYSTLVTAGLVFGACYPGLIHEEEE